MEKEVKKERREEGINENNRRIKKKKKMEEKKDKGMEGKERTHFLLLFLSLFFPSPPGI